MRADHYRELDARARHRGNNIAGTTSFENAAVIGDCALRRGMRSEDVARALERLRGRQGMSRARVVAEFIEPGAESPGESISRVRMRSGGWPMPMPMLQHEIRRGGRFAGRVDFFWKEHGVVGELDEMVKYRSGDPGNAAPRADCSHARLGPTAGAQAPCGN